MSPDRAVENHILVVADSVRFDSAVRAHMPFVKSLGTFREAWAHGTFTWPSHMAMMMGMLPHVFDNEPLYNRYQQQLWRLGNDRGTGGFPDHPFPLAALGSELSIVNGFRKLGCITIGTGAVSWFKHPIWPSFFDHFAFLSPADAQLNWLSAMLDGNNKPFFVFVNFGETHEPYSYGRVQREMPQGYQIHKLGYGPLTRETFAGLHQAQVDALEFLDSQIHILWDMLPPKTVIVITSDHGECFGEDGFFGHGFYHPMVMRVPLLIAYK